MGFIDTMTWYNKYIDLPFKHLGDNPQTGIDCVNLCIFIYKDHLRIDLPFKSYDYCNIVDENWYNKVTKDPFLTQLRDNPDWVKVKEPKPYDIIVFSIGSTNVTNHCCMYVDNNKILHTAENRKSWVGLYGTHYKQYTVGIYRWKALAN